MDKIKTEDLLNLPRLGRNFFQRDTVQVAKELIGKIIFTETDKGIMAARIVETEAYLGSDDPACHAARGKTNRNAPMFEAGGILYVYKIYGIHFCANIVTEGEGTGSAVLLRAAEPLAGIDIMIRNRGTGKLKELLKGPGNFAKAFDYNAGDNYTEVGDRRFMIADDGSMPELIAGGRIGITQGCEYHYRFYEKCSDFVSAGKVNCKKLGIQKKY